MSTGQDVRLRITVRRPPSGVRFAVQRGPTATAELVPPAEVTADRLSFDVVLRVILGGNNKSLRFLGPFTQGPPAARFIYVNSGQLAGDTSSCWNRRAKVFLTSITPQHVTAAMEGDRVLEAEIEGTGKDGGPTCATTPLLGGGWHLVPLDIGVPR